MIPERYGITYRSPYGNVKRDADSLLIWKDKCHNLKWILFIGCLLGTLVMFLSSFKALSTTPVSMEIKRVPSSCHASTLPVEIPERDEATVQSWI